MTGTIVAMVVMAVLFVLYGLSHRGVSQASCSGGNCTSCSTPNECEIGAEGRLP